MVYSFTVTKEKTHWVAKSNVFQGCSCMCDTLLDAIKELETEESRRIKDAITADIPLPEQGGKW